MEPLHLGSEDQESHPCGKQLVSEIFRHQIAGTEAVNEHMHRDAASCGVNQRIGNAPRAVVIGKNVGLQEDLPPRAANRRLQRGEILDAVAQQRQPVALGVIRDHSNRRRADSAAWSEMRDHGKPWCTSACCTKKPRT